MVGYKYRCVNDRQMCCEDYMYVCVYINIDAINSD